MTEEFLGGDGGGSRRDADDHGEDKKIGNQHKLPFFLPADEEASSTLLSDEEPTAASKQCTAEQQGMLCSIMGSTGDDPQYSLTTTTIPKTRIEEGLDEEEDEGRNDTTINLHPVVGSSNNNEDLSCSSRGPITNKNSINVSIRTTRKIIRSSSSCSSSSFSHHHNHRKNAVDILEQESLQWDESLIGAGDTSSLRPNYECNAEHNHSYMVENEEEALAQSDQLQQEEEQQQRGEERNHNLTSTSSASIAAVVIETETPPPMTTMIGSQHHQHQQNLESGMKLFEIFSNPEGHDHAVVLVQQEKEECLQIPAADASTTTSSSSIIPSASTTTTTSTTRMLVVTAQVLAEDEEEVTKEKDEQYREQQKQDSSSSSSELPYYSKNKNTNRKEYHNNSDAIDPVLAGPPPAADSANKDFLNMPPQGLLSYLCYMGEGFANLFKEEDLTDHDLTVDDGDISRVLNESSFMCGCTTDDSVMITDEDG